MAEDRGEIKLQGFDELAAALKKTPEKIRVKILRNAQRKSAKVIADDAGRRLGKAGGPGNMVVVTRLHQNGVTAQLGPSKKKWYLWFREFGTSLHEVKAKNKKVLAKAESLTQGLTGYHLATTPSLFKGIVFGKKVQVQMSARPFLRPAFDSKKEEAVRTLGAELGPAIEKAMKESLGSTTG